MCLEIPRPGRAMTFPEWSAVIVDGVRAYRFQLPPRHSQRDRLVVSHRSADLRKMHHDRIPVRRSGGQRIALLRLISLGLGPQPLVTMKQNVFFYQA
jgi:hypothetical protein